MRLLAWQQRVLPEAPRWRFLGGLTGLAGGILLGIAGVTLFLIGEPQVATTLAWRKVAILLAACAAPLIFTGISLALPGGRPMRWLSASGVAFTAAAIWMFVLHYPQRFNVGAAGTEDKAPLIASLFAVGAAIMTATLLAQIVAMALRRHGHAEEGEGIWEDGYEVSERQVERDIDEAMRRHPVTWGAAPKPTPGVELGVPSFGADTIIRGRGAARRVEFAMPGLERSSERLRSMGAVTVQVPEEGISGASDALGELRRLQAAHPKQYRPPHTSWWRRLWRTLTGHSEAW